MVEKVRGDDSLDGITTVSRDVSGFMREVRTKRFFVSWTRHDPEEIDRQAWPAELREGI